MIAFPKSRAPELKRKNYLRHHTKKKKKRKRICRCERVKGGISALFVPFYQFFLAFFIIPIFSQLGLLSFLTTVSLTCIPIVSVPLHFLARQRVSCFSLFHLPAPEHVRWLFIARKDFFFTFLREGGGLGKRVLRFQRILSPQYSKQNRHLGRVKSARKTNSVESVF